MCRKQGARGADLPLIVLFQKSFVYTRWIFCLKVILHFKLHFLAAQPKKIQTVHIFLKVLPAPPPQHLWIASEATDWHYMENTSICFVWGSIRCKCVYCIKIILYKTCQDTRVKSWQVKTKHRDMYTCTCMQLFTLVLFDLDFHFLQ